MKIKLLPKLIMSLIILGVILTVSVTWFSYQNSKTYLEDMYSDKVISGSKTVADMLDVEDVKKVIAEDGDKTSEYKEMVQLFNKIKKDNNVTYLSLTIPDEDSVHFYIDANVPEMGDDPNMAYPYNSDWVYEDLFEGLP